MGPPERNAEVCCRALLYGRGTSGVGSSALLFLVLLVGGAGEGVGTGYWGWAVGAAGGGGASTSPPPMQRCWGAGVQRQVRFVCVSRFKRVLNVLYRPKMRVACNPGLGCGGQPPSQLPMMQQFPSKQASMIRLRGVVVPAETTAAAASKRA